MKFSRTPKSIEIATRTNMIASGKHHIQTAGTLPLEIVNLARTYAPEAIAKLFATMQSDETPPAVVVKCAEVILDRAYGKAPQAVLVGDANAQQQAGMASIPVLDRVAAILEARNITSSVRDLEASEITVDGEMTDIPPEPPQPINVTPPPPPPPPPPDTGDDLI
jgi:hypothetical protein